MASITIRDLPDQTKEALRVCAAQRGVSLEAYLRQVLQEVSQSSRPGSTALFDLSRELFAGKQGVELDLPPRRSQRSTVEFDQ